MNLIKGSFFRLLGGTIERAFFIMSKSEIFKDIPNYKGIYQVSNLGTVRSLDHYVPHKDGRVRIQKGRVLKTSISKKGYIRVSLSKNGKRFNTGVHRLIAICFIDNLENKSQVNHKNGVKDDNRVENLEWCTNTENVNHAIKNNLTNPNYGENHHQSKLTNNDVKRARLLHKKGKTNAFLARNYGVSYTAMSNILNKKTYINV